MNRAVQPYYLPLGDEVEVFEAAFGALAAVFGLVRWMEKEGGDLVGFLMLDGRFVVAWGRLALEQLGLGVALGLTGSFIAVRRFLRV